jgi:phage repressor protein C with HTH and peptisase S24 domain
MSPRFEPGETLYINPHKPAVTGDDVLIEFVDGTGVVKRFRKIEGDAVLACQFNPVRNLEYPLDTVKKIYLIDGSRRRS